MALDPDNMRGPQNVGGMLISLGHTTKRSRCWRRH
jgi:hypothetical protein